MGFALGKNKNDPEKRTLNFALRIIRFVSTFPRNTIADVLGRQLMKAGTSIGANYREPNGAESRDDFIHKIGIVQKEAGETRYWLELFQGAHIGDSQEIESLLSEASELLAIFVSSGKTAKSNRQKAKLKSP